MILKIILLVLATICTMLFLVGLLKGEKYEKLIENLDASRYGMKDFLVIGFFMNDLRLFRLRGKIESDLKMQSRLIWDNIYYEYYALVTWAQFLTYALLTVCIGLILCGLINAGIVLIIMVLAVMAEWNLVISNMKEAVEARKEACEMEFPNMISKLSLLIDSGMILREAWEVVSYGKDGELYELMRKTCDNMKNGASDASAIYRFGILSDSPEIKKFTSSMIQGISRGNKELSDFLMRQASEQLAHKRQLALQEGEKAAGKLIVPLGITFAGIIMIIVSAAMQSMSF